MKHDAKFDSKLEFEQILGSLVISPQHLQNDTKGPLICKKIEISNQK